jgi:NADPH:quinone reductase-like Zn-dependent oxidoreductase
VPDPVLPANPIEQNLTFPGSEPAGVAFLTDLLEKRQLRSVIDGIYDFQDIPEALKYQAEGKAMGKIVISLTPLPD